MSAAEDRTTDHGREEEKLFRLFKKLQADTEAGAPDFSGLLSRAPRQRVQQRQRARVRPAFFQPGRLAAAAVGLVLLVLAFSLGQDPVMFPSRSAFDIQSAAEAVVSWQPPTDTLFSSTSKKWFTEDAAYWQGPSDDLFLLPVQASFENGKT